MRILLNVLAIALVLIFSIVASKSNDYSFTMTQDELMSIPINEEGITEVPNTMEEIQTTKRLSSTEEEDNEQEAKVTEADLQSLSSIAKAIKVAGSIIKKVIMRGWKFFKIKAGVLKNLIISKGKALPNKLFTKIKTFIKDIKGKPAQVNKLFKRIRKDGILKVIKHYRAKNLQQMGAMGLIKVTTQQVGSKQIVKFSTKEFSKNLAKHVFKSMVLKKAKGLAKKFAKEYAKHVYNSAVANEVKVETKKFDAVQKLKDFFIPTDLCWRNSYGRGF